MQSNVIKKPKARLWIVGVILFISLGLMSHSILISSPSFGFFIPFLLIIPFMGIWTVLISYDIGSIYHGGSWKMFDRVGLTLTSLGTFALIAAPITFFIDAEPFGNTILLLLNLGISLLLVGSTIMRFEERGITLELSFAFAFGISPCMFLLYSSFSSLSLVVAGLLSLISTIIVSFDGKNPIEESTTEQF